MNLSPLSPVAADVKRAVDAVFFPLEIEVWEDSSSAENGHMIDYTPPFFLDEKCNEMTFGIYFQGEPKYPLVCRSAGENAQLRTFTVQNADDWINHAPSFVTWYNECVELMDKFTARKK
jgi:hypothetical protein